LTDLTTFSPPKNLIARTALTMRAVRFHGRKDIRLDEVDEPNCGRDQVKVCASLARVSKTKESLMYGGVPNLIAYQCLDKTKLRRALRYR
jgi:hypothetical protein